MSLRFAPNLKIKSIVYRLTMSTLPLSVHMKNFLVLLIFAASFSKMSYGQFVWSAQNSGFTTVAIKDVYFKDVNNGWGVCEMGYIIRTTDGGNTWSPLS